MNEDLLKVPQLCAIFFKLLILISDWEPEALIRSPQMLPCFFRCVDTALDNVFGTERTRGALEIIHNLAKERNGTEGFERPQQIREHLQSLTPVLDKLEYLII